MTIEQKTNETTQLAQALLDMQTGFEMMVWSSYYNNKGSKNVEEILTGKQNEFFEQHFKKDIHTFLSDFVHFRLRMFSSPSIEPKVHSQRLIKLGRYEASFIKGGEMVAKALLDIRTIALESEKMRKALLTESSEIWNPFAEIGVGEMKRQYTAWFMISTDELKKKIGSFHVEKFQKRTILQLSAPEMKGVQLVAFEDGVTKTKSDGYEIVNERLEGISYPSYKGQNIEIQLIDVKHGGWCMKFYHSSDGILGLTKNMYVIQSNSFLSLWEYVSNVTNESMNGEYMKLWIDETMNRMHNKNKK